MDDLRQSWSTQQLVDFLAVVSAEAERIPVLQTAIERAAEALEADVGAIVEHGSVVAATGFGPGELPESQLAALAQGRRGELALPWGGSAHCLVVPIGGDGDAQLILGRDCDDGFGAEEAGLLRGMARVLALTRRSLGLLDEQRVLLDALHERGQALEREALYDSLTGLANRRAFLDAVRRAATLDRRADRRSAVLLIDVDDFKAINDALGHHAGDAVLCAVADRVRECIREGDTAARLGGDEFAILLEDCGENGAELAAARIVEAFVAPFAIDGRGVIAGVSVGVSLDTGSAEDMLRQADLAMYAAKAAGKDRYASFVPAMQLAADRRRALESDLRRALEDCGLFLQYQPIVRLADEAVVGAEALLRWQHPERGLLPPAEFIPLAEEAGLIVPLGRWVLGEATRQAAAWRERWPWLGMGVNVSGLQVTHPDFIAHVTDALAESGLRPHNLILELTESVLMRDVEATIARLWEAKELGVQIAADDFGTGYSSLQYLDRFPLDILKLPRTFVEGLGGDGGGTTIARAVVELGHNLGLRVVGEGIEQPAQLAALRQMGCSLGQGFHFARPLDPGDFELLLEAAVGARQPLLRP